ncbi:MULTISPECIES: hypothetical protein [unclassified Serratia (in: enterobacteria)]|uniref:hypothetical protein n=1 Tax=unclassified Serratia (in: enterobacteria) TaxID=2647522 RepID=UPI002ED039F2|nr:hypothetical protein [Serratia sp. C2(2)]MEE4448984.1 hypothetical protein [Serratia sp. C2(1)]
MDINRAQVAQLFNAAVDDAVLQATAKKIALPQRLSWLYIMANVREDPLDDQYFDAINTYALAPENPIPSCFDWMFAESARRFSDFGVRVDRLGLEQDIILLTNHIAAGLDWSDLHFDPAQPHFIRHEFLHPQLTAATSLAIVCELLAITCISCAKHEARVSIDGMPVEVQLGDDSFADLQWEGGARSASLSLRASDLRHLTPYEALELSHELGHCRNHLASKHPTGDYGLPFWDTELPAFREEWRLCSRLAPEVSSRAWALEAIKQSVFALFPLLAPELGVKAAFNRAVKHNPIYGHTRKEADWLLLKPPLFVWSGVPYVQYFLSLVRFLLETGPYDEVLAQGLTQCQGRFSLYVD